ncbi:MAG: hypothetical protein WC332_02005 [Clostridia bacterium]|jgi:hypothetical protein
MNNWLTILLYLSNLGTGILFASHMASMKMQDKDKESKFRTISNNVSYHINRFSEKISIPSGKTQEFTNIVIFFIIICILCVITVGIVKAVIVTVPCIAFIFFIKKAWERNINDMFQKNAYKLYRYLISQIMAGVKPKDVIINMYKITEDKNLNKILMQASAAYSLTLDGKTYAQILKRNVKTEDANRFCMILEEDLLYTDNEDFLEKMEEMMFNRHFSYHQKKTESIKRSCFAAVCVFMLIVIIMVALPLINELVQGLKYIFL